MNPRQPNLLFLMTDQQFGDMIAGLKRVCDPLGFSTPHLDRLLANGCFFDRAYATQPLCVPCRNSVFTGRYPHETGVTINRSPVAGSIPFPMMGTWLSRAGYDCGYVGKWHLGVPHTEIESHGFAFVRHAEGNQMDSRVAAGCSEFFKQWKGEKPFCLVASWVNPHDICEYARIEGGIDQPLPNGGIGTAPSDPSLLPELRGNHHRSDTDPPALEKVLKHPDMQGIHPIGLFTELNWRRYMWAYHRMVEKVDSQIGELLQELDRRGLTENTVIVFTSDHGDGYGSHGWNQKSCFYEEVVRVPFLICGPGVPSPGILDCEHLLSIGLDVLPTLLDFAGADIPPELPGLSVKTLLDNPEAAWRESCLLQTEFGAWGPDHQTGVKGRCVVSADMKYIQYFDPEDPLQTNNEQLFNLACDPGEQRNLALEPDHRVDLGRYRCLLAQHLSAAHNIK